MDLDFTVTGTDKAATKASVLLTKSEAGAKIRKTEWPAWQRRAEGAYWLKKSWSKGSDGMYPDSSRRLAARYAEALGLDEDELDPRAINWDAYGLWCAHDPRNGACDVCGRGTADGAVCGPCTAWSEQIAA